MVAIRNPFTNTTTSIFVVVFQVDLDYLVSFQFCFLLVPNRIFGDELHRFLQPRLPCCNSLKSARALKETLAELISVTNNCQVALLGPFHGAIAVPSVTRCRRRRCGH